MAETYREIRDPYLHSYSYYQHHHQQSFSSHLPRTPDYLGTPPSSSAAIANFSAYHLPPSPHHSSSGPADYWYQYPSYGQYPPTPTSPHSPYSPYSSTASYSPTSHFHLPHIASPPRSGLPELPDYLNPRESHPPLLTRNPYELRQRVRKRRASSSAIAELQTVRLVDLPEDDRNCNICMEPYIEERFPCDLPKKENAMKMPCGHVFGSYCLKQWLQSHNTCPACRMEVDYVEVEEEEPVPRSRAQRRPSLSTHELIVNDLFGEPYRDPTPARSKTPHPSPPSRARPYFGAYEAEPRPGTVAPANHTANRPALRRSQTSMGSGGPVRYPFARPPSEDYGRYGPPSPQRSQGMREAPFARPGSSSSSAAATTQSEPSRGSDGYYSQPGLPSSRVSTRQGNPFRRDLRCIYEGIGLCVLENEEDHVYDRLVRLECGHGFHSKCLYTAMKTRGDPGDLSSRVLWCERCRKHLPRKSDF